MAAKRAVLFLLGLLCLLIGIAGVLLPVIPGTPFLILAAAAFNRSSPRFHRWLLATPALGKAIRDWERTGSIRLGVKLWVTVLLAASVTMTLLHQGIPLWARVSAALSVLLVLSYLWTRPRA